MDEHALRLLASVLNEVKDLLGGEVFLVEEDLVFLVEPVEGEIDDTNGFPVVGDLPACTVNDVRHLVSNNKLQILIISTC